MDIDLLSKMIKELILDTDEVALPGVGTFVAEIVPSTFSDKGYTINPPYRRLSFRQRQAEEDTMLSDFYASSNNLDKASAELIINDFLRELKDVLQEKKTIIFPGLGRLRATRENNFFFVADEDLDIYPAGFGLESVSLKTHEETPEAVAAAITSLKNIMDKPEIMVPAPAAVPPIEEPAKAEEPVKEETPAKVEEPVVEEAPAIEETPAVEEIPVVEETTAIVEEVPVVEEIPAIEETPVVEETVAEPEPIVETEPSVETVEPVVAEEPVAEEEPTVEEHHKTALEAADYYVNPDSRYHRQAQAGRNILKAVLWIIIVLAALLVLFVLLSRVAPNFIDKILYTKEELEILRY